MEEYMNIELVKPH